MNVREFLIAEGIDERTVDRFLVWHLKNPIVWKMFERKALDLIAKGKTHWGSKCICEIIRFERAEIEGGQFDDYGVNNNHTMCYARVFEFAHRDYIGFFEKREAGGLRRIA